MFPTGAPKPQRVSLTSFDIFQHGISASRAPHLDNFLIYFWFPLYGFLAALHVYV